MKLFDDSTDLTNCHSKFRALSNRDMYTDCERDIVESWTDGFVDKDNKILTEFRDTFHSAFWEFYLYALFKRSYYKLDQSHNRPDFMITNPYPLYVEAVTSNIKEGGKPESQRGMNDILSMVTPPWCEPTFYMTLDESIVRLSNSVKYKHQKIKLEYPKCYWVDGSAPFALAISSHDQINYGREYIYSMMALLYGLYFNAIDESFSKKKSIKKPDTDSDIPLGLFLDPSYEEISGVLFSCTHTLGKLESLANSMQGIRRQVVYLIRHVRQDKNAPYKIQVVDKENPERLEDGLFLFHNPFAKNKIPIEMFHKAGVFQMSFENGSLRSSACVYPLVARISFDKRCESKLRPYIQQQIMLYNRVDRNEVISYSIANGLL